MLMVVTTSRVVMVLTCLDWGVASHGAVGAGQSSGHDCFCRGPGSLVRATRTGPGQAGGVAWPNTGVRMPGGPVAGRCKPSGPGAASVADDGEANSGASLGSGG